MSKLIPERRFKEFSGEWEEEKISKFFKTYSGGTPSTTNKSYYGGTIPFIRSAEINKLKTELFLTNDGIENSSAKLVKKGDVLYALYGANSGDVAISKIDGAINQAILCLDSKEASNSFLYYNLTNIKTKIINQYIQGGQGNLSGDIIKSLEVFFPKEKQEQQKIANCLNSLDSLIDAQNKKVEALKAHKKGLIQQLFPSEGRTVPKLRFDGFNGEWEEKTLLELAKFRRGSFPQPYGLPEWYDDVNGTPFIQVFDVDYNLKLKSNTKRKISTLGAKQSVFIPKETVIVTIQGSIGRVAITQYDAYIDRTLLIFEKFHQKIDKLFFAYTIENLFEIEKMKAPGGIIKTITKEVLSSFIVKLPSYKEQKIISNNLYSLDNLIEAQNKKVEALKAHKKGLMQQLFVSGEG